MRIEFIVPGPPRGKGRPRFSSKGHAYTDDKTAAYENLVKLACQQAMRGKAGIQGPASVFIEAHMPISKGEVAKVRKQAKEQPHTKRPDTDNIVKAVLDGINGVAFADDAQVWQIAARKTISNEHEPGVYVAIEGEGAQS